MTGGGSSLRRMSTTPDFRPVERVFNRLVGRVAGGGALVVRLGGETVVDLAGRYLMVASGMCVYIYALDVGSRK